VLLLFELVRLRQEWKTEWKCHLPARFGSTDIGSFSIMTGFGLQDDGNDNHGQTLTGSPGPGSRAEEDGSGNQANGVVIGIAMMTGRIAMMTGGIALVATDN